MKQFSYYHCVEERGYRHGMILQDIKELKKQLGLLNAQLAHLPVCL